MLICPYLHCYFTKTSLTRNRSPPRVFIRSGWNFYTMYTRLKLKNWPEEILIFFWFPQYMSFFIKIVLFCKKKTEDLGHSFSIPGTRWNIKISSDQFFSLSLVYIVWKFQLDRIKTVGGDRFGVWPIFDQKTWAESCALEESKILLLIIFSLNECYQINKTCSYKILIFLEKRGGYPLLKSLLNQEAELNYCDIIFLLPGLVSN